MKIDTEILCSFIDGQLDEPSAQAVQAAIQTDQDLRREYEDLLKTAQLVRSLPQVSAPPDLSATITAHAERNQLLGPSDYPQSRPSKFRWTLSMAASLLVGVSLGILGYRTWPEQFAPSRAPSESAIVAEATDYEHKDQTEMVLARKPGPSVKLGWDYRANEKQTSDLDGPAIAGKAGEELEVGSPIRSKARSSKGAAPIARSGPSNSPPVRSRGAYTPGADAIVINNRPPGAEQVQDQIADALGTRSEESAQVEQGARDALAFTGDVSESRAKSAVPGEEPRAAGITVQNALEKKKTVPLGYQVLSNNYVNQSMAKDLKFEAEPLNVKVVSNDSAKTLQFVQQWAQYNYLIDLNQASRKSNFPAFSQVVYQGKPGTNTDTKTQNGIFVRTTRSQARQIVNQLQQQKPLVVSVSVKDEKKLLPRLAAQQPQQQILALRQAGPLSEEDADKEAYLQIEDGRAGVARQQHLKKPANEYLYSLTNQVQVRSLDDLVTLVFLVEDAPPAVKTKAALPATPESPESNTKPE